MGKCNRLLPEQKGHWPKRSEEDAKDGLDAQGTIRVQVRERLLVLLSRCSQDRQSHFHTPVSSAGCSATAKSHLPLEQPHRIFYSSLSFLLWSFLFALSFHLTLFTLASFS